MVAAKVPELRALDLCTSGDEATDAGILAILASCPELRALYLPCAAAPDKLGNQPDQPEGVSHVFGKFQSD